MQPTRVILTGDAPPYIYLAVVRRLIREKHLVCLDGGLTGLVAVPQLAAWIAEGG
jgi:hypothetical protein